MKTKLIILILLASLGLLVAQTNQFIVVLSGTNVVPPTSSTATGSGAFTLEGLDFNGGVFMPSPFIPIGAAIHGPASTGSNAPALFELNGPFFVAPNMPSSPGGIAFAVSHRTLTAEEIQQLKAGLWYVNVRSSASPEGEIRGQILPFVADSDGDGVPDDADQCANTTPGDAVNSHGCSITQLCSESGNAARRLQCIVRTALEFQRIGIISRSERRAFIREAIHNLRPRK